MNRNKLNSIIEKIKELQEEYDILKYGTSEGATRAWDSRGRGQKEEPKTESKPTGTPKGRSNSVATTSKGTARGDSMPHENLITHTKLSEEEASRTSEAWDALINNADDVGAAEEIKGISNKKILTAASESQDQYLTEAYESGDEINSEVAENVTSFASELTSNEKEYSAWLTTEQTRVSEFADRVKKEDKFLAGKGLKRQQAVSFSPTNTGENKAPIRISADTRSFTDDDGITYDVSIVNEKIKTDPKGNYEFRVRGASVAVYGSGW
jgi:hypothetical protein